MTGQPGEERNIHPNSLANLKPFEPGVSGNSAGRKPGSRNRKKVIEDILNRAAADIFKEQQKKVLGEDFDPATVEDQMVAAMLVQVMAGGKGAVQAFHALMDGKHGKMTEKVETAHSFTQMGRVKIAKVNDQNGKETQSVELSFNVGSEPEKLPPQE